MYADMYANSRRPLDHLQYVSALCDLVLLTFDLKTIPLLRYPKVVPYTILKTLGLLILINAADRNAQMHSQTDTNEHFAPTAVICMSN